ncbi:MULTISPECIES: DUF3999 family protein [unclassified Pseudoxanthomonas]|uniref:DUF3999 family protein n=1 Tax=unclassified Pseudoxanthomonas TaxID=2645906 RepID=UPI0008DFE2F4|nr:MULTISPECIES: DUF3999 family protein [unclassified Pseudoxanthomonas]PPJ43270.1 DUF3999 domain-containing protein [Pseudoxanthomonas sp. KAs_5_3]SFV34665.1 Protein of unknown function [Pseudoxanthomonas sp. YR558]
MRMFLLTALVLMAASPVASAQSKPEGAYAKRWPLALSAERAGAYRVELDRSVYATTAWPDLRDVNVLDAQGKPVSAALFGPEQPTALPARRIVVPWFPLPTPAPGAGEPSSVSAQFGEHGRIVRIEASGGTPAADTGRAFLVDLSGIRDNPEALEITWDPGEPREARFRVEGSHDLQTWDVMEARVTLMELQRGTQRLLHDEAPIRAGFRYVRFVPLDAAAALPIREIRVRLDAVHLQQTVAWSELQGRRVSEQGVDGFVYRSDGRYPIALVDLAMDDFAVGEWTLESRDADDTPWRLRAGPWVAYRVDGDRPSASPDQPLSSGPVRDREWRLRSRGPLPDQAPTLRLGYRPEVMVFLAQGTPPYALVAGSAAARRASVPMPELVDALRRDRGEDWQPAPAYLSPAKALAGDAALVPPPTPRDWKAWLLWGLLLLGAVLVAAFAFSLLRSRPAA